MFGIWDTLVKVDTVFFIWVHLYLYNLICIMFSFKITQELQQKVFELTLALYRVTDFFPQGEALRKHLREKANEIFGAVSEFNFSPEPDRNAIFLTAKIEAMKGYLALARSLRFVKPINLSILEREYAFLLQFFMPIYTENSGFQTRDEEVRSPIVDNISPATGEDQIELVQETKEAEAIRAEEKLHDLPKWEDFTAKDAPEIKLEEHTPPRTNEVNPVGELTRSIEPHVRIEPTVDHAVSHVEFSNGVKESEETERVPYKNGLSSISHDINERQKKILEHMRDVPEAKISDFYSVFSEISSKTIQRDLQDLVVRNVLKKEGDKRWTIYSLNMSDSL